MTASPAGRRLVAVRLAEVPDWIRQRAKDQLLRGANKDLPRCDSISERIAVGIAADQPSQRIYWVSESAYTRVMTKSRGGRAAR